jgi:hypothetical protein
MTSVTNRPLEIRSSSRTHLGVSRTIVSRRLIGGRTHPKARILAGWGAMPQGKGKPLARGAFDGLDTWCLVSVVSDVLLLSRPGKADNGFGSERC